jgi:polysaccharide biosynthesis/export protein
MARRAAAWVLSFACTLMPCAAFAAQSALPTSDTTIHPGDQLGVLVFGDPTLTLNVTVLPDGTIEYPLVGRVAVAGRTPVQAATKLAIALKTYVRHPQITVSIVALGQPDVLVLGDVKTPGKYQLRSGAKVTDAIAAAGGVADTNGAFPDARVADANGKVTVVSLEDLLQHGNTAVDVPLGEGSVVYVPGAIHFIVDVSGAVDHPGDVQVNEGDRLSVAIAKAGNSPNAQADLNHIRVIRTNQNGVETATDVNLYQALKGGNQSADISLEKGDVIYVPQASKHTDIFSGIGDGLLFVLTHIIP